MGNCDEEKKRYRTENIFLNDKYNNNKSNFKIKNNIIGFSNIGNSCYMNSFLQILLHCPNFINEINILEREHTNMGECLLKSIIELSKYPKETEYLYSIKNFMKNISDYETSNQNDSQEFGKDLINQIIINIKKIKNFRNDSESETENYSEVINNSEKKERYKHFLSKYQKDEIYLETIFVMNECEILFKNNIISNLIFNTSFDIELSFPTNKNKEYLNEYSLKDLLEFKYNNNSTKKSIKKDETKICRLPKILIISIIRTIIKKDFITSILNYPKTLDLKNYIDNDLISFHSGNRKLVNTQYKLFATNNKNGNYENNGHYYCQIYIENNWFFFSDETVRKINIDYSSKNIVGLFYELIEKN